NTYIEITNGKNPYLYDYISRIFPVGGEFMLEMGLQNIGTEVALAYKVPILKQELNELKSGMVSINTPLNQKMNWKAGPAYLGHLIDELVRNGYVELPNND